MKYLIAGLGNIGPQYAFTRHNIGFMALDRLAASENLKWSLKKLAYHTTYKFKGREIHLIKPTTYMNLSGTAVKSFLKQENIATDKLLIIMDDLSLPTGKIRIRPKGSAGGHNGLKDIEARILTQEYARLKFGIGSDFPKGRQADYVLGNFTESELAIVLPKLDICKEVIQSFSTIGIENTMNSFNV